MRNFYLFGYGQKLFENEHSVFYNLSNTPGDDIGIFIALEKDGL